MRPKETPEQKAMNRELARKAYEKYYGKTNPIIEEIKRRTNELAKLEAKVLPDSGGQPGGNSVPCYGNQAQPEKVEGAEADSAPEARDGGTQGTPS